MMDRKNSDLLQDIKCFLLDMDGTIYLGDRLLPGAAAFLAMLEEKEIPFYFLTNNSSKSRLEYTRKLKEFDLDYSQERIFTSGEATAIYIKKYFPQKNLYLVGTPALEEEFKRHGLSLVDEGAEAAVLGFDTTLTYEKLWKLCDLVRAGKPYIATHPDLNCPIEDGFMPDIGAMIAFVKTSTGREPDVVVGKPNAPMVAALEEKTGFQVEQMGMIGDRLYTDIAMGKAGIHTILVLSGETRQADLKGSIYKPDLVVQNMAALSRLYKK